LDIDIGVKSAICTGVLVVGGYDIFINKNKNKNKNNFNLRTLWG
jgi:hypothetical protein